MSHPAGTATHPMRTSVLSASWYVTGQLLGLAIPVGLVVALAALLSDQRDGVLLVLAFVVLTLAVAPVRDRIFRNAWGDVPGAFGLRSAARGDTLIGAGPSERHGVGWAALRTVIWVGGGMFLVSLDGADDALRAGLLASVGGVCLGSWLAVGLLRDRLRAPHRVWRWNHFLLVDGLAWLLIAFVAIPGERLAVLAWSASGVVGMFGLLFIASYAAK